MNNQTFCPITMRKYLNRGYTDISAYDLLLNDKNEFYIYIPDIAVPGIKPFGYLVSNYGNIFSVETDKFLQPMPNHKGYLRVELMVCKYHLNKIDNQAFQIHRLVLISFSLFFGILPLNYSSLEVNHKNGDKTNNRFDNLEFCTPLYNCYHRDNVLNHNLRSLSKEQVEYICCLYFQQKYRLCDIEKLTNINYGIIKSIIYGKSYKDFSNSFLKENL